MHIVRNSSGNVRANITRFSVAFFLFYFGQKMGNNFEGISKIPVRETFNTTFGLSAADAGALLTSISVGWYIKALLGTITDGLPIMGMRRKPYLLISNLGATAAWFWLAAGGSSTKGSLALGLTVVNICVAFSDVVVDGLMVQSAQKLEAEGRLAEGTLTRSFQAWQWAGASVAVTLAALAGGVIAAVFDVSMSATISGIFLLVLIPVIFWIKEERVAWDWELAQRGFVGLGLAILVAWYYLWSNGLPADHWFAPFQQWVSPVLVIGSMLLVVRIPRNLWAPMVLVFFWQASPFLRDSTVFFTYFTEDNTAFVKGLATDTFLIPLLQQVVVTLHIATPEKLATDGFQTLFYGSVVETVSALGSIAACLVTVRYLSRMSFGSLFRWCLVGTAVSDVLFMVFPALGVTSPSYLLVVIAFQGFVYMVAVLAIVGYAGARTPSFGQASIFAFMMGLSNLGGMLGAETVAAKVYTDISGKVTEMVGGKEVSHLLDADRGFMVLACLGLISLLGIWVLVRSLEVRGFVDKK